jgi:hypothetical protein
MLRAEAGDSEALRAHNLHALLVRFRTVRELLAHERPRIACRIKDLAALCPERFSDLGIASIQIFKTGHHHACELDTQLCRSTA